MQKVRQRDCKYGSKFATFIKKDLNKRPSLVACIIMDLLGYLTYTVPLLGEFADIIWAPVSGAIFFAMFGGWKGAAGGIFNFLEELLPGTDFIPSFTIMWLLRGKPKMASGKVSIARPLA